MRRAAERLRSFAPVSLARAMPLLAPRPLGLPARSRRDGSRPRPRRPAARGPRAAREKETGHPDAAFDDASVSEKNRLARLHAGRGDDDASRDPSRAERTAADAAERAVGDAAASAEDERRARPDHHHHREGDLDGSSFPWDDLPDAPASLLADYLRHTGRVPALAPLSDYVRVAFFDSNPRGRWHRCLASACFVDADRAEAEAKGDARNDRETETRVALGRWCASKEAARDDALAALRHAMLEEDKANARQKVRERRRA